jgi:hypothetical protein
MVITAIWFFDNYAGGYVNWAMVVLFSLFALQLLLGMRYMDKVLGMIAAIGTFYMLMAVSMYLNKVDKATAKDIRFFLSGLGIFGLGMAASLFIIYYHYLKRRKQEALIEA